MKFRRRNLQTKVINSELSGATVTALMHTPTRVANGAAGAAPLVRPLAPANAVAAPTTKGRLNRVTVTAASSAAASPRVQVLRHAPQVCGPSPASTRRDTCAQLSLRICRAPLPTQMRADPAKPACLLGGEGIEGTGNTYWPRSCRAPQSICVRASRSLVHAFLQPNLEPS